MRAVVDPRFPARLRELRQQRGLTLRALAARAFSSTSYLSELENGLKNPTVKTAKYLDGALDAGGELAAMVVEPATVGPDDKDRLSYVARNPRRLDADTVGALETLLAAQRRLEDGIGSAPIVAPVLAQLHVVESMVVEAPDDGLRTRLVDVAGQWAQFAAWLCVTTDDHDAGKRWYLRALEWATEAGNPHMVATALSMRGHLAWIRGQTRAMVELSRAATWQPASAGVRSLAVQQEARGLALLGDAAGADGKLEQAADLAAEAGEHRDREPPWMYFYDPDFFAVQRGLAQRYLDRPEHAAEMLDGGLSRLAPEIRHSDWIGWYVCQLASAHADAGNADCARTALDEARAIAAATGAARLANDVERVERQLDG